MKLEPSTQQIDFKGRRALVTGAGKGIGREIAVMLHRFNAQVVAVSRTEADLKALEKEIGLRDDRGRPWQCNGSPARGGAGRGH